MDIKFEGKRALVTGAGEGIGKGIAKRLVECGAKVVAFDILGESLEKLKQEVPEIETYTIDISKWEETKDLVSQIGPFELLVNNAGTFTPNFIGDITEEEVDRLFAVNVKATLNITQEVAKGMIENKKVGCSIVNLSSQNSDLALKGIMVYCATKAAIDQITRVAALELGEHQIRVNAVKPTLVKTNMTKHVYTDPLASQTLLDRIPLHRFAKINDVVNLIVYLLSDKSDMITGACIPIDGGYTAC